MVTLYATIEFTKGVLKGTRVNQTYTFPTTEKAMEFVRRAETKGIKQGAWGGGGEYKIVDRSFQNYFR